MVCNDEKITKNEHISGASICDSSSSKRVMNYIKTQRDLKNLHIERPGEQTSFSNFVLLLLKFERK